MKKTRTTLKIDTDLKLQAEIKALKENTTLQNIFNDALRIYLNEKAREDANALVFYDKPIDQNMGKLGRKEIYDLE